MSKHKQCFKCKSVKPIGDYYKHPRMADGHLNKCKECQKENTKAARGRRPEHYREYEKARANLPHRVQARAEYAKTQPGKAAHKAAGIRYGKAYPNKRTAHYALNNAVRDGKVTRLPCSICGKKAHAHHPDYDRPLDVIWLCPPHHKQEHKKQPAQLH